MLPYGGRGFNPQNFLMSFVWYIEMAVHWTSAYWARKRSHTSGTCVTRCGLLLSLITSINPHEWQELPIYLLLTYVCLLTYLPNIQSIFQILWLFVNIFDWLFITVTKTFISCYIIKSTQMQTTVYILFHVQLTL